MDLPKVVSGDQEALIIGPAHGVDVSSIWAIGPQALGEEKGHRNINIKCIWNLKHTPEEKESSLTKHLEAESAGVGVPLNVSGGFHADHLFTHRWDPWGE